MKTNKTTPVSAENEKSENISRKEALKKAGIYAAFTAGTMLFLMTPKKAQAGSQNPDAPSW